MMKIPKHKKREKVKENIFIKTFIFHGTNKRSFSKKQNEKYVI